MSNFVFDKNGMLTISLCIQVHVLEILGKNSSETHIYTQCVYMWVSELFFPNISYKVCCLSAPQGRLLLLEFQG